MSKNNDSSSFAPSSAGNRDVPSTVADVMTREVMTLCADDTFAEAVKLMANHHVRHLLVVDTDGRLLGVISDRDILRALARTGNWEAKEVSQLMTPAPITVTPNTRLHFAIWEMLSNHINCLPVVGDDETVCGILTSTDLLKSYHKLLLWMERDVLAESAADDQHPDRTK